MKRAWPLLAFLAGGALLALLLPPFLVAQPKGLSITRRQARAIANREARALGIETDNAYVTVTWERSYLLEKELEADPAARNRAWSDPVVGPRLGAFRVTYFREKLEKWPEYGFVIVGRDGRVEGARRRARNEAPGAKPDLAALRPQADAFLASRPIPGAPTFEFETARPTVLANRSDHYFRYRVASNFPAGRAAFYVGVFFVGDQFAGWLLIEEYKDGSQFRFDAGSRLSGLFLRYAVMLGLLGVLLVLFLKKYHAGEVGIGVGAALFAVVLVLSLVSNGLTAGGESFDSNFGGIDARSNALAFGGFLFLFYLLPFAVLVFLAWSVGESFARERWGARLAAFDAIFRRDVINATVGGSVLTGLLAAPAVAAATWLLATLMLRTGLGHASLGDCTFLALISHGGPLSLPVASAPTALILAVLALLFVLSACHRWRRVSVGVVLAVVVGALLSPGLVPIEPESVSIASAAGSVLAAAAVFFAADLLAATVALFGASLVGGLVPFAVATTGAARAEALTALGIPFLVIAAVAAAGLSRGRRVVYAYEDLAPHVKRIVERERVKAEIDAANRIQAALLPAGDPKIRGTSVASHYNAATEIGGDYFDFLPLADGTLGLAFGDVSGHGLTSGIVMSMAKSALLVQVDYDASPRRVMEVLNEIVIRTAPKRILMTFFFGVLDPDSGELRFSSAGHLDPYVYRAESGAIESLSAWGFPLGVKRREPFREHVAMLEPGDRLVLFSDGLIEALDDDGEPFGFDRFEDVIRQNGGRSAEAIRKEILQSVKKFTRGRPPEDDQTLVVISYEGVEQLRKAG